MNNFAYTEAGGFADDFRVSVLEQPDLPATPEHLSAAAAGMTSLFWRNTETVEDGAHAGDGVWHDRDMLRKNTRVTQLFLEALQQIAADEEVDPHAALGGTFYDVVELLPTRKLQKMLLKESLGKVDLWARTIEEFGLGRVLSFFGPGRWFMSGGDDWWGMPQYGSVVERLMTMGPPDPDTFRQRMLTCPWELTDEQADFVCDHRYDHGNSVD